ncbi:MAG: tubulin/FtsZ family protein [Chloroflexota bacterium]
MKLMVIGLGQCGCRIADEFVRSAQRARMERRARILTGVFAVNTDQADLSGLRSIKADYVHRVLIGTRKTLGHGVGKLNEVGAELARLDGDKILEAIRSSPDLYSTHAFMLTAGAAGGTGSGSLPIVAQMLKERYIGKPIYALVALPFDHEIATELRSAYNTAVCLKSIYSVADAVFLADNQRYVKKDTDWKGNLQTINQQIVMPFYDLLCSGEVTKTKYVGAKTVDAGDIMQSLEGWTAIGFGRSTLPVFRSWLGKSGFRDKMKQTMRGVEATDAAITNLSVGCSPSDASRALALLSAPGKEMNVDMTKEMGSYLRELAKNAVIRTGDFPGEVRHIDVTVVLSGLGFVPKIKEYYDQASKFAPMEKERAKEALASLHKLEESGKDLPSLI